MNTIGRNHGCTKQFSLVAHHHRFHCANSTFVYMNYTLVGHRKKRNFTTYILFYPLNFCFVIIDLSIMTYKRHIFNRIYASAINLCRQICFLCVILMRYDVKKRDLWAEIMSPQVRTAEIVKLREPLFRFESAIILFMASLDHSACNDY